MRIFIAFLTVSYTSLTFASEHVHERPNLLLNIFIQGKRVEFLGTKGSDQKNNVPVYSKNCDSGGCRALIAAKQSPPKTLKPDDLQNGEDPAYLFCEKTGGKLVSGTVEGRKHSQLFCEFRSKKQLSYIDPAVLWMIANKQI